jgi:hypothetical protein
MEETGRKKVRTICIDTLTAIQTNQWMEDKRKPGHDQWMDYGQSIYAFMHDLQELGFETILILGEPGTGKSSGLRGLEHDTNIWYNTDEKNPVWIGGREEYGRKNAPRTPYHIIPKSYAEIIVHIKAIMALGGFEDDRFAFVLGHTEVYKKGNDNMERLKTLGKVATKMQIEGKLETVLYSRVEMEEGKPSFILETQNNGFNTARSHQGMFEGKIPNDYGFIIGKLIGNT